MIELILREGRKRQVRRMCEAVGHPVKSLKRVAFGPLVLGELREGSLRALNPAEVDALRQVGATAKPRRAAKPLGQPPRPKPEAQSRAASSSPGGAWESVGAAKMSRRSPPALRAPSSAAAAAPSTRSRSSSA